MKKAGFVAKAVLLLCGMLQTLRACPQDSSPVFEIASIRMSDGECSNFAMSPPDGNQFYIRGVSMMFLLGMAYRVENANIRAASKGLDSKCFDIRAKGQGEARLSPDDTRKGLQQLLASRFDLRFHRATQEQAGYDLETDGTAILLPPSKGGQATGSVSNTSLHARNIPMHSLAGMLAHVVGAPVQDNTQLSGNYDIDLRFSSDVASTEDSPSIFRVLQKQLGLRLKPGKVAVDLFIVDSVRQEPTDEGTAGSGTP
jgi:uncharacterized protein (TIGR03435 family)